MTSVTSLTVLIGEVFCRVNEQAFAKQWTPDLIRLNRVLSLVEVSKRVGYVRVSKYLM